MQLLGEAQNEAAGSKLGDADKLKESDAEALAREATKVNNLINAEEMTRAIRMAKKKSATSGGTGRGNIS